MKTCKSIIRLFILFLVISAFLTTFFINQAKAIDGHYEETSATYPFSTGNEDIDTTTTKIQTTTSSNCGWDGYDSFIDANVLFLESSIDYSILLDVWKNGHGMNAIRMPVEAGVTRLKRWEWIGEGTPPGATFSYGIGDLVPDENNQYYNIYRTEEVQYTVCSAYATVGSPYVYAHISELNDIRPNSQDNDNYIAFEGEGKIQNNIPTCDCNAYDWGYGTDLDYNFFVSDASCYNGNNNILMACETYASVEIGDIIIFPEGQTICEIPFTAWSYIFGYLYLQTDYDYQEAEASLWGYSFNQMNATYVFHVNSIP